MLWIISINNMLNILFNNIVLLLFSNGTIFNFTSYVTVSFYIFSKCYPLSRTWIMSWYFRILSKNFVELVCPHAFLKHPSSQSSITVKHPLSKKFGQFQCTGNEGATSAGVKNFLRRCRILLIVYMFIWFLFAY